MFDVVSINPKPVVLVFILDSLELSLYIVVNYFGTGLVLYICSIFAVAVTGLCYVGYIFADGTTLEP